MFSFWGVGEVADDILVVGSGGFVLFAFVVEEGNVEPGFGFAGGEVLEVISSLAGFFGVWRTVDVVFEGFAGFEPRVAIVSTASKIGHSDVTDLVLSVICDGVCGVAFHHGLIGYDGFLSAALAFEEKADVVLGPCGDLGVRGLLDDAFEHLLGALVRGEEFDAEDAAFFSVHVTFCDAVHGFDGIFEVGTVRIFLEVLFEAFEGVVVFAEGFEEGTELESGGFCLGA